MRSPNGLFYGVFIAVGSQLLRGEVNGLSQESVQVNSNESGHKNLQFRQRSFQQKYCAARGLNSRPLANEFDALPLGH